MRLPSHVIPRNIKKAIAYCEEARERKAPQADTVFSNLLNPDQYTVEENIDIATYFYKWDESLKRAYPHLSAAILAGSEPALDKLINLIIQRTGFEEKVIRSFCQKVRSFATFDDLERSIVDSVANAALPPKMTLFSAAQSPTDSKQSAAVMSHNHKKLKKD